MTLNIQIDDWGLHVFDEDNQPVINEDEMIDYIWAQCEYRRTGRMIMKDPELAENQLAIENINTIINNYFAEKEDFIESNNGLLMRLALTDTEEDLAEEAEFMNSDEAEE